MGCRERGSALVVALSALLVLLTIATADQADAEGTTLRVERSRLDVGTVRAGDDVVATFVFRNAGDRAVKIIRAKPS